MRAAGWLADYIEARADENMRSYVLGGVSLGGLMLGKSMFDSWTGFERLCGMSKRLCTACQILIEKKIEWE